MSSKTNKRSVAQAVAAAATSGDTQEPTVVTGDTTVVTGDTTKEETTPVVEDKATTATSSTTTTSTTKSELTQNEAHQVELFKSYLTDYEAVHVSANPNQTKFKAGFDGLHAAIRQMVGAQPKAQKACFAHIVTRITSSDDKAKRAYKLPTLTSFLGDDSTIKSSTERVFFGEFLVLLRKFALSSDKGNFVKTTSIERTLGVITDDTSRKTLLSCFGK